ncbi:MAG: thioredoxin family protein [Proteobacteria bacterium]|nr:MAG: thioredoxin family protein [Pseudomonadota bacterium]QKK11843.1 MAG: thioredoxin family protein [Pseudomonadota bacterium]
MKRIKVLGSGCANCITTARLVEEAAKAKGVEIKLEKIEDVAEIMRYGVMSTPAVVVDDKVVHAGSVPARETVSSWF